MQKISFGSKEYVKASQIAKRFRYTQDYVGQLCRNKKVDARLVGRTWYVEPESVVEYRKTKHATQKKAPAKVAINASSGRVSNPKPVDPVIRAKTAKATQQPAATEKTNVSSPVQYSSDNEASIPIVQRPEKTEVRRLAVKESVSDAAPIEPKKPAKKIKIKKAGSTKTNFKTEKLPEISLSGKLKVKDDLDDFTAEKVAHKPTKSTVKQRHTHAVTSSTEQTSYLSNASVVDTERVPAVDNTVHEHQTGKAKAVSGIHFDWFIVSALVLGGLSALVILSLASLGQVSSSANNSWTLFFDFVHVTNLVL